MKLNWGNMLALSMGLFIIFIVYLGIQMGSRQDNVVEKDYYAKGLVHDEQMDKIRNAQSLHQLPDIQLAQDEVFIVIPDSMLVKSADLWLFRPNASDGDIKLKFSAIDSKKLSGQVNLNTGRYIAKLNWTDGAKEYYLEKELFYQKP